LERASSSHSRESTARNIQRFRRQLRNLGLSFDWSREVVTSEPRYYQWTQWMFLRAFKRGLAYKALTPINWCPSCKASLANEEVVRGACERCGAPAVRRMREQWMLRITGYADPLLEGLDSLDFIPGVAEQQRNWIGRSRGAEILFPIRGSETSIPVFTARPHTLFGVTHLVLAPEHPLVGHLADRIANLEAVRAYQEWASRKSGLERTSLGPTPTGAPLEGVEALHPATGGRLPVWISEEVPAHEGTGAVMAVPGHDRRDWAFARAFGLPILRVVQGSAGEGKEGKEQPSFLPPSTPEPFEGDGILVNSSFLDGLEVQEATRKVMAWLEREGKGKARTEYRLRDWVFSRQRYWGEPIPLVHCRACGWVALPETELPLLLPELQAFHPSSDGSSPLARLEDWVSTVCPACGGPARRETDTMPQWAGSCWYFLRYIDPHNGEAFADPGLLERWMPVDWYDGGMEHTTLHLLYSRFWHRFLHDEGLVPTPEPYRRRTSHGMVLGTDGEKMSKSRGNVVNPDEVVARFGADTFRVFEMFMGDFDQAAVWSDQGIKGVHRFLNRVWDLARKADPQGQPSPEDLRRMNLAIRQVGQRTERMKFNTAVSSLMEWVNELTPRDRVPASLLDTLCRLLHPYAPHLAEEVWTGLGRTGPLQAQPWPRPDASIPEEREVTVAIQVNGRLRGTLQVPAGMGKEELLARCFKVPAVRTRMGPGALVRSVFVPDRIINLIGREP
jgi:leucyl-tRNA synthetase